MKMPNPTEKVGIIIGIRTTRPEFQKLLKLI
jgi:hypothetical protein